MHVETNLLNKIIFIIIMKYKINLDLSKSKSIILFENIILWLILSEWIILT